MGILHLSCPSVCYIKKCIVSESCCQACLAIFERCSLSNSYQSKGFISSLAANLKQKMSLDVLAFFICYHEINFVIFLKSTKMASLFQQIELNRMFAMNYRPISPCSMALIPVKYWLLWRGMHKAQL